VVDKVERLTVFGDLDGVLRDTVRISLLAHRMFSNRSSVVKPVFFGQKPKKGGPKAAVLLLRCRNYKN
jgi:hypothetical protein